MVEESLELDDVERREAQAGNVVEVADHRLDVLAPVLFEELGLPDPVLAHVEPEAPVRPELLCPEQVAAAVAGAVEERLSLQARVEGAQQRLELRPVVPQRHLTEFVRILDVARDSRGDTGRDLDLVMPWPERLDLRDQVACGRVVQLASSAAARIASVSSPEPGLMRRCGSGAPR